MRSWRHGFHRRPELGFEVQETADSVANLLRTFGVEEVYEGVGSTGVIGVLRRGESDNAIGLRADMDALPILETGTCDYRSEIDGVFHGCGHDGHTAMLLGAAKHLSSNGSFDGTAYFVFQPDEENGRGAAAMIDDGLFGRFPMSAIYGMHNKPGLALGSFATRVGPMMSSEDLFEITIEGRGGHASTPERHIDPVVIAAEIVQALQTIVSRSVPATEIAIVSVTELLTDGARNIIPSTVVIRGDCRTFSGKVQDILQTRMRALVAGICAAHGALGTVSYQNEFIPLVNTERETEMAIKAAASIVGASNVDGDCTLVTGSEDFAQFLKIIPGCFIDIGNGVDGVCGSSLHNPKYDFNDEALRYGSDYWIQLVQFELPIQDA